MNNNIKYEKNEASSCPGPRKQNRMNESNISRIKINDKINKFSFRNTRPEIHYIYLFRYIE